MREALAIFAVFTVFIVVLSLGALIFETESNQEENNAQYIHDIRTRYAFAMSDDRLIAMGRSICQDFDAYMTENQVMESVSMSFNVTPATAAVLIEPATSNFCSQYKEK
jgi:hypothetical protein